MVAKNELGNADFVKRLIKGEPSRAEQILNKIVQIKNALSGEKGAAANKELAFVRRAEQLYLNAIAELGGTYRDGKISFANREEEKEGEGVDVSGEVGYNDSEVQFARKPVTPKKRIDRLINSTFPTEDKSGSEANRLAIWWVHKKYVETGDRALISYHGRWYLIQKFDSMDLGYLIMKRVKVAEYEWYKKEIERDGERNDTRIEILDEIAERFGARDFNDGTKSSSNSDVPGYGQQDSDVLRLAAEQRGQKSEFDGQSGADHARSGTDQQGGETELKLSRKSANRNHDKVYTKSDARKVLSDVLREQLVFGNEQAYGALYGKHYTEVVDKLWHVLNDAAPGERGGVALDMADYIIDNAAVESMDFSESAEALERVQILREYLHKLDLSGVSKHLADKYGKQWRAKRGTEGVSLEKVAAELRAKEIVKTILTKSFEVGDRMRFRRKRKERGRDFCKSPSLFPFTLAPKLSFYQSRPWHP